MGGEMMRTLLAEVFLSFALCVSPAACRPVAEPTPREVEAASVTIQNTYYIRFQIDGDSYHAVPIDGDDLVRGAKAGYLFEGPVYVRKEGEELWRCWPRGYQVPAGARIMISSSRAPVTVRTWERYCRE
jgi:hypothetical protein